MKAERYQAAIVLCYACALQLVFPSSLRADLTFLNSWGSYGSADGQFNGPTAVAVGPNGTVYVTDNLNNRVQYFSPTGTFEGGFGSYGGGDGQFVDEEGIGVASNGTLYVADYIRTDVQIFDSTGDYQGTFGVQGFGLGQLNSPYGVAVSPAGTVYIGNSANADVVYYNSSGGLLGSFGSAGSGPGQFGQPSYGDYQPQWLAVNAAGDVYVSDPFNSRIQYFNSTGAFLGSFASPNAAGVAVSSTGLVYAVDPLSSPSINVYNSTGNLLSSFGGDGEFNYPENIAVAPTGMVYVTEPYYNQLERLFDPDSWVSGTNSFVDPTIGPTSVAVGPGQILGTSFALNPSMGLVVGDSLSINPGGTLTLAGGTLTTGSPISNNGLLVADTNLSLSNAVAWSGALTVGTGAAPVTVQLATGSGTSSMSALTISPGSTLDITNNKLVINYGASVDPVRTIRGYIVGGLFGGSLGSPWTGAGITSSSAAANPTRFTIGYLDGNTPNDSGYGTVSANQIIVAYTLPGDAFLQGSVGFDDLLVVAQHYQQTGWDWAGGNFNYDPVGSVGFSDLLVVAQNYNQSAGVNGGLLGQNTLPLAWQSPAETSAVPEPAAFAIIALGSALSARRRRLPGMAAS